MAGKNQLHVCAKAHGVSGDELAGLSAVAFRQAMEQVGVLNALREDEPEKEKYQTSNGAGSECSQRGQV